MRVQDHRVQPPALPVLVGDRTAVDALGAVRQPLALLAVQPQRIALARHHYGVGQFQTIGVVRRVGRDRAVLLLYRGDERHVARAAQREPIEVIALQRHGVLPRLVAVGLQHFEQVIADRLAHGQLCFQQRARLAGHGDEKRSVADEIGLEDVFERLLRPRFEQIRPEQYHVRMRERRPQPRPERQVLDRLGDGLALAVKDRELVAARRGAPVLRHYDLRGQSQVAGRAVQRDSDHYRPIEQIYPRRQTAQQREHHEQQRDHQPLACGRFEFHAQTLLSRLRRDSSHAAYTTIGTAYSTTAAR